MNLHEWNDQLAQAQTMLAELAQRSQQEPEAPALLQEILETLSATVEELTVTGEELCQQQDELNTASQQLAAERARYQDLFDAAPDAYLVTDIQGAIQEANRAAGTLLNTEPFLLAGRLLLIFVMPENQPQWIELLQRIMTGEQVAATRLRMRRHGGNWLCAELSGRRGTAMPNDGAATIRWIIRNVTVQVNQEQALRTSEAALARVNAQLEQRIVDRTARLARTVAELQQEIAERKRARGITIGHSAARSSRLRRQFASTGRHTSSTFTFARFAPARARASA